MKHFAVLPALLSLCSAQRDNASVSDAWPTSLSGYPPLSHNLLPTSQIRSVANLTLEDVRENFQENFFREPTTPKSARQVNTGSVNGINTGLNPYTPGINSVNTVNSLSPGVNTFNTAQPRAVSLEAFTARRASFSIGVNSRIKFEDTITQVGTGWDKASSEFTSVDGGVFMFSFSAITDRNTFCRISLQLNGVDVVSAFGDLHGYQTAANSALVQMKAGDRVYLTLQQGRLYDVHSSRAYTTFTGFRVL